MKSLAAAVCAAVLATASAVASAIEEPAYTVVERVGEIEVRQYPPYVVAEVIVPGPSEDAGNQGFRILAGYIFGKNEGDRKIAMTAPVAQAPSPTKIEMTAPVSQTAAEGGYVVRFAMPREYTLETLPVPLDPQVKLRQEPGGRFAVIRYSGTWSTRNYDEHLETLKRAAEAAGLRTTGSPVWARYDPPWVPWFMRRNEIWLKVDAP